MSQELAPFQTPGNGEERLRPSQRHGGSLTMLIPDESATFSAAYAALQRDSEWHVIRNGRDGQPQHPIWRCHMKRIKPLGALAVASVSIAVLFVLSSSGVAQVSTGREPGAPQSAAPQQHGSHEADARPLAEQLRELREKVAHLEAALKQKHARQGSAMGMSGGMGGGRMKSGMGGGVMKSGTGGGGMMSGMGGGGKGGGKQMGMGMMGRMKGMGQMLMQSALPGYPGASHIYHVGATGFFLDHADHITLSSDQQIQLNKIKETALLAQGTYDRQIDESEQQLWMLTSSDSPDATKIEARIGEIAKLNAEKRIAFIRAVGEAAGVLSNEQRQTLIGMLPSDHAATEPQASPPEESQ